MNKYYKPLTLVIAFLILSLVTVASFAYFSASVQGNNNAYDTVITTGEMALMLNDGEQLRLNNAIPGDSITKEFSVKNTGTVETTYDVYFSELLNEFEDKDDLVYTITSPNGCSDNTEKIVPSVSSNESKMVNSCSINPNQTHNYSLTITFKNDGTNQDDNKGKRFKIKISVNEYKEYDGIAKLISGSDLTTIIYKFVSNKSDIHDIIVTNEDPTEITNKYKVSTDDSDYDIYLYYQDNILYYNCKKNLIQLNESSPSLFSYFKLDIIDLSKFDFSQVKDMSNFFSGTGNGNTEVILGENFDTSNLENMYYMFGDSNFKSYDFLKKFNTSKVTNMMDLFARSKSNIDLELSDLDLTSVENISYMFSESNFNSITFNNISIPSATNLYMMFKYCNNLKYVDLGENLNAKSATNLYGMFYYSNGIVSIDFGDNFNPESATNFQSLIYGCKNLVSVDFGNNFNPKTLGNNSTIISDCPKLETVNFGDNFNPDMTNSGYIFFGSRNLKTIYLGNSFRSKSDYRIDYMFSDAPNLETIYVGPNVYFDTTSPKNIFSNNTKLKGGAGTTYSSSHVDTTYARIDDPEHDKPGYFTLDPKYQ